MRCQKPNTDHTCEVFICTGGKPCSEYVLDPQRATRDSRPDVFETFIPVNDGEQVAVHVKFSGTVLHGAADILADGAFVFDRRIEGDKKGLVKFQKRDWKVDNFYNVPQDVDIEAMHSGRAIVSGNLFIKSLDEGDVPLYVKNGGKLGLGSIAVIISVNQDTEEMHSHGYQHQTIGKWRDIRANHADGGIKPMHELEFQMEDDEVHFNRQARHKRHLEQTRFGLKPWAVFVFFYRPQADIQQTCILRPDKVYSVTPFLGEFMFADPDAIMKKRLATRARHEREKADALEEEEDFGNDGYDTYSTRGVSATPTPGLFVSRSPSQNDTGLPKKRLFGNTLATQGAMSYAPRKDSRISEDEIATAPQNQAEPNGDWQDLFGDDAMGGHDTAVEPQEASYQPQNSISGHYQGDDFDFNLYPDLSANKLTHEIDQALQAGGLDGPEPPAAAPVAKMVASSPGQNRPAPFHHPAPGDVVHSVEMAHQQPSLSHRPHPQHFSGGLDEEEQAEPSPLAQIVADAVQNKVDLQKAAKTARTEAKAAKKERPPPAPKVKPVFDPTAKTGYGYGNPKMAPKQPTAPTRQAMQQLDAQDQQTQGMLQQFLQTQTGVQQYAPPLTAPPQTVPYNRPWETSRPPAPPAHTQYPMSPPNKIAHPNVAALSASASPQPMQASPHTPATALPRKRAASIASHGSTSSKKARAGEVSARKAALMAQLQAQNKAKADAHQQLDEQRRTREDMERRREEEERMAREQAEAEEAEIAAMEAQLECDAAETEAINEQGRREAEDARMRELEREREGEE